jgi:glycosyltransferase involved in cell wall biosynthesis
MVNYCSPVHISVIMPIFNGARFLNRAIHSLYAQTFSHWELLAVDDCSTDYSYELLCKHSISDARIHAYRLMENCGPSAARNHALRHAKGFMITYLDCDDEYYPNYLEYVSKCKNKADGMPLP